MAHVLGIEYCHLQVRGKTLGITVKDRKFNDHMYPAKFHRDSFIFSSVSNQFFFMFQLFLTTSWYIYIYSVNTYVNILKYIQKSIFLANVRICSCLMSFELSALANYVHLHTCLCEHVCSMLHLCSSTSPPFMRGHFQIYAKFVDFICQFIEKCNLLQSCTRVRLSVCVCAWDRMSVPICICALDPGIYKNAKHFRFILGLLLFYGKWKKKTCILLFPLMPRKAVSSWKKRVVSRE